MQILQMKFLSNYPFYPQISNKPRRKKGTKIAQGNGRFLGEPAPTIIIPRLGSRENDWNKPMERPVPQMVQVFKHGILTVPL